MDEIVLGEEEDVDVDIEEGVVNERQEENVWSGRLSYDASDKINDDDLINPLIGGGEKRRGRERSSQSLDLSDTKFAKNTRKPPRPPKGPSLSANDQKLMREIAELAMRKRARVERMKTLRRMKAVKSSTPCSSVFAMIVTVLFFVFLIFQGLFTSNASLSSDNSPAPSRMVAVQLYNEFAPRERIDASPTTTSFRYKRVSGADNEEDTREVTR